MKLDIKTIFIIILGSGLLLSLIFRRPKPIDKYEDEIKELHDRNTFLLSKNDSLKLNNDKLTIEIDSMILLVDEKNTEITEINKRIKELENGKTKVTGYVRNLAADDVARELTEYLNKTK